MNIIERVKHICQHPESVSIVNIMSAVFFYSLENYMQMGAAISFFATTLIAIISKYSTYKQDRLDRIHKREVEMLRLKAELQSKESVNP